VKRDRGEGKGTGMGTEERSMGNNEQLSIGHKRTLDETAETSKNFRMKIEEFV
jgi:hypothetical protein